MGAVMDDPVVSLPPETVREGAARRAEAPSQLAADGSVEVPVFVRAALGVGPGDYVVFVRDGDGGIRIVPARNRAAAIEVAPSLKGGMRP